MPRPKSKCSGSKSHQLRAAAQGVVLNATGYIVAAHKIELAAKVIGKVKWIGVEKGDQVKEGQVLVRLEDDEYRAQLDQAKGNLANLEAHWPSWSTARVRRRSPRRRPI